MHHDDAASRKPRQLLPQAIQCRRGLRRRVDSAGACRGGLERSDAIANESRGTGIRARENLNRVIQLSPIDTTNYKFHTGDKFMVHGRPSLPGHMEIYNVNTKGQQTLIDSSDMAAG